MDRDNNLIKDTYLNLSQPAAFLGVSFKFLLTAVDVFSRIAYVLPLKDKTGKSVEKALSEIIKKAKVRKVRSDAGSEFKNKLVKKLLDDNNIYHHVALNDDIKANYVERFNRTLKMMIFRYLTKNKTDRYIDVLPKLVESYNSTPHRSLGNIAPNDVNKENEADLFAYMYLKPKRKDNSKGSLDKKTKVKGRRRLYKYNLGQLVRISNKQALFQKGVS